MPNRIHYPYDFSFVMPVYNESQTIIYAISNVLSYIDRTKKSAEIIVIDDDSRDDTYKKLLLFEDDITIIKNKQNVGYVKSLIKGIERSSGATIFTLSPDNVLSDKIIDDLILKSNGSDLFLASSMEDNIRYTPLLFDILKKLYTILIYLKYRKSITNINTTIKIINHNKYKLFNFKKTNNIDLELVDKFLSHGCVVKEYIYSEPVNRGDIL